MTLPLRFLIIDGYPKPSRDVFDQVGMTLSFQLYANMLSRHLPEAVHAVWLPADSVEPPEGLGPEHYHGVLWTGCNLTIYHHDDERVTRQIAFSKRAYQVGTPQYGSCWGIQMAAFAAGGEVQANPKGREMGIGRRMLLTDTGRGHPMMEGKPRAYNGFVSHDDQVTSLPPGAVHLAENGHSRIQALAVTHQKGTFWATQYHAEYNLYEVARLIVSREYRLVPEGFFADHDDLVAYVSRLEALHRQPDQKHLRWQLDADDTIIDDDLRQLEFHNFLHRVVLPAAATRG